MRRKMLVLLLAVGFSQFFVFPVQAEKSAANRIGARWGFSIPGAADEYFQQYDLFYDFDLPWSWRWPDAWSVDSAVDISAGALKGGGETAFIGSSALLLRFIKGITTVQLGGSIAGLSKNNLGNADFGGPLQFLAYVDLNFRLTRHLAIGGRLQHMSNGHIYHKNPSLNQGMLLITGNF